MAVGGRREKPGRSHKEIPLREMPEEGRLPFQQDFPRAAAVWRKEPGKEKNMFLNQAIFFQPGSGGGLADAMPDLGVTPQI